MERGRQDRALADEDRVAVDAGRGPRRPSPVAVIRGARMNTPGKGCGADRGHVEPDLERVPLAAVAVADDGDVEHAEAALVGPSVGDLAGPAGSGRRRSRRPAGRPPAARRAARAARSSRAAATSSSTRRRAAPARRPRRGSSGVRTSTVCGTERLERGGVLGERALEREDADLGPELTEGRAPSTWRSPAHVATSPGRRA